jgi:PPOX class probable F420-dependent enzyme
MIPESHKDILEKPGIAHAATLGPRGEPHSTPVWYAWDGEHLVLSTLKSRQKYRNLGRDPRIALSILDPDNPYRQVTIRGTVVAIDDDTDLAAVNSLAKKYLGQDTYPWHQPGDERVVVKVKPSRVTTMG